MSCLVPAQFCQVTPQASLSARPTRLMCDLTFQGLDIHFNENTWQNPSWSSVDRVLVADREFGLAHLFSHLRGLLLQAADGRPSMFTLHCFAQCDTGRAIPKGNHHELPVHFSSEGAAHPPTWPDVLL